MRASLLFATMLAACSGGAQPIPVGPDEAAAPGCEGNLLYGDPPPPYELTVDGMPIVVRNGQAWMPEGEGTGIWMADLYDPDFARHYIVEGCAIYRISDDGSQRVAVGKERSSDFEGVPDFRALIDIENGFTAFVLQSPLAPTVADYVALRACFLDGTCEQRDNTLELTAEAAHDGAVGLRATSLPPTGEMVTAKASIESELVHFIRGDTVRMGAWYRRVSGTPYGLMDLESAWMLEAPGIRLLIEAGRLEVELKWANKPRFVQRAPIAFPADVWVRVEWEVHLEPDQTGSVRVWQDGELIIDELGQTLPLPNTILNSWELGITANNEGTSVLDVDGVTISRVE
jgi:hypothetical protein